MGWENMTTAPETGEQFLLLRTPESTVWISVYYSTTSRRFCETFKGFPIDITGKELWHKAPELPKKV